MNPDQTPAHLPALLPPTATLLHRTQGALGLLRDVVQESSAEYWYERGKAAMAREEWDEATVLFHTCTKYDK
jgi:outer membrane protein assembly factor BamD (BamD/ComL family)